MARSRHCRRPIPSALLVLPLTLFRLINGPGWVASPDDPLGGCCCYVVVEDVPFGLRPADHAIPTHEPAVLIFPGPSQYLHQLDLQERGWTQTGSTLALGAFFQGVQLDRARDFLSDPRVVDPAALPAAALGYRRAIPVALSLIREEGVTFGGHPEQVTLASLLLNMDDLFEKYVRAVLVDQMRIRARPDIRITNGKLGRPVGARKPLFDDAAEPEASPDIVVEVRLAGRTSVPIVMDAKYKPLSGPPARPDLNQVITYAASYSSNHAVVVHPVRDAVPAGLRYIGHVGTHSIHAYGFDLAVDDPMVEERRFADAVLGLSGAVPDA